MTHTAGPPGRAPRTRCPPRCGQVSAYDRKGRRADRGPGGARAAAATVTEQAALCTCTRENPAAGQLEDRPPGGHSPHGLLG